jgi:hypothetical protein
MPRPGKPFPGTAFTIPKRLQWDNKTVVVLPARVH